MLIVKINHNTFYVPESRIQNPEERPPLLAILGPTGVGKSEVAINLLRLLTKAIIIPVDSTYDLVGLSQTTGGSEFASQTERIEILGRRTINDPPIDLRTYLDMARTKVLELKKDGVFPILEGCSPCLSRGVVEELILQNSDAVAIGIRWHESATAQVHKLIKDRALTRVINALVGKGVSGDNKGVLNEFAKIDLESEEGLKLLTERSKISVCMVEFYKILKELIPNISNNCGEGAINNNELLMLRKEDCHKIQNAFVDAINETVQAILDLAEEENEKFKRIEGIIWIDRYPKDDTESILNKILEIPKVKSLLSNK